MRACKFGMIDSEVNERIPEHLSGRFNTWMNGQTMTICDGKRYNHEKLQYEDTGCGPHGPVTYSYDVERFLVMVDTGFEIWD